MNSISAFFKLRIGEIGLIKVTSIMTTMIILGRGMIHLYMIIPKRPMFISGIVMQTDGFINTICIDMPIVGQTLHLIVVSMNAQKTISKKTGIKIVGIMIMKLTIDGSGMIRPKDILQASTYIFMMTDSIIGYTMIQFGAIMHIVLTMKIGIIIMATMVITALNCISGMKLNKVTSMIHHIILGLSLILPNGMLMVILSIIGILIGKYGFITILMTNILIVGKIGIN